MSANYLHINIYNCCKQYVVNAELKNEAHFQFDECNDIPVCIFLERFHITFKNIHIKAIPFYALCLIKSIAIVQLLTNFNGYFPRAIKRPLNPKAIIAKVKNIPPEALE
jgi:hypothetical protein